MNEKIKLEIRPLWDTRFPQDNNRLYEVVHVTGERVRILYIGSIYECNSFVKDSEKFDPTINIEEWLNDISKRKN